MQNEIEDRKQSDIWLNEEKCIKLKERWGDYNTFNQGKKYNKNKKVIIETLNKLISKSNSPSILEVGCGCGHFLWSIKDFGISKIIAFDYSPHMLEITKKQFLRNNKNIQIDYMQGSCWELPFDDNYVDISYQVDVCMHIGGAWQSIKEMIRVSKKYILFTGVSFDNFNHAMDKKIGKLSWAISKPLLKNELDKMIEDKIIRKYKFVDRERTKMYKHKILIISK